MRCLRGGVKRLLQNVFKTLTATSLMSLSSATLMGIVGAIVMFIGRRQITGRQADPGRLLQYTMFLGYLAAPLFQVVGIGTQITEAIAGLERTREVLSEKPEDEDPGRTVTLTEIDGEVVFENVTFAYDPKKTVLHDVSFHSQPGTVTALVGSSGSGKSTIIGLIAAFHKPNIGQGAGGWGGSGDGSAGVLSQTTRSGVAGFVPVRRNNSRERGVLEAGCDRGRDSARVPDRSCG